MSWSIDTSQNRVSADQYHVIISLAHIAIGSSLELFKVKCCFFKWTADQLLVSLLDRRLMSG